MDTATDRTMPEDRRSHIKTKKRGDYQRRRFGRCVCVTIKVTIASIGVSSDLVTKVAVYLDIRICVLCTYCFNSSGNIHLNHIPSLLGDILVSR